MQQTICLFVLLTSFGAAEAVTFGALGPRISIAPMAASVVTLKYTGDVNGISTDMVVSFERLPDYVLVAGVMQNRVKKYTFGAELYGDSGFGTILDLGTGSSWQIKIQIRDKFLVLISNPLGPGSPTVYTFKLVESK